MKKAFLLMISFVIMLSLSGCMENVPTEIEATDFDGVQALLEEQYEVVLPQTCEYIGGYFDNAFRDPCITVVFSIGQSELKEMLSENWVETDNIDEPTVLEDYLTSDSFSPEGKYDFQEELFTYIWYAEGEKDEYICVFKGRHPNHYIFNENLALRCEGGN